MSDIKIAKTLDAKHLSCPLPILKTRKAIAEIEIGEFLEVLSTDPGSVADFKAWTNSTGHELADRSIENEIYRYIIKRTK
ncbi:MAG: sulfurtransferase TusA family protein [Candidatus Heimdallarchaeota archaeon]|nr:sulfurtransferase TusA family protein [Candidatus Heimdallarchaeota archaeon]MCG3254966.1 sulfurtransferase TusA family protein [Candidatus Heimdallarchaeota archaeon]MCK4610040.1 sulfurtransferase TusA family protein [Candidatus Heimdallarchaeota archaeon]